MKKLILAFIALSSLCFATEKKRESFNYNAIGLDLVAPAFTIGCREWKGDEGFDINTSLSSILIINRLSINAYYLKKLNDNTYLGIGAGTFLALVTNGKHGLLNGGVCPNIKFGRESTNYFDDISISVPQFAKLGTVYLPLITYRHGFKF